MNIRTANISDILQLNSAKAPDGSYGKQALAGAKIGNMPSACYTEGIRQKQDFINYTKQGWDETESVDANNQAAQQGGGINSIEGIQNGIQDFIQQVTPDSYEKFSDMGMIPDQENPEDFLTVSERIQIQMAATCEDYIPTGSIDIDDVQAMYGSTGRAYEISSALKQRGLNVTSEAVSEMEQSLKMAEELKEITPEMSGYLLKNDLPLTLENVYKAQYSVTESGASYKSGTLSDTEWGTLSKSLTQQMEALGMEVSENTLADGKWLVEQEIPVTAENLQKLDMIRQLNDLGAGEGLAGVSGEQWIYGLAEEAVKVFEQATPEDVEGIVFEGKEVTLLNMKKVQEETTKNGQEWKEKSNEQAEFRAELYVKKVKMASVYLEEIQLTMSVSSFALLMKNGMDLQISSLKDIAEGLEQLNHKQTQALFHSTQQQLELSESIYTQENVQLYESSMQHFQMMTTLPVQVLGEVAKGEVSFEVETMEVRGLAIQRRMEAAGEAYETMGTRVRRDLGDSISKAFRNVDDMLEQMNLDITEENQRAVRILAYNQMELTNEHIMAVKSLDLEVTRLVENMTPKTAIYLIANGINPLKTDIRKLNDELEEINDKIEADTGEHFSEFLWKLDKTNGITPEDRKAFLGIYKTLNRIQKHDRGALGEFIQEARKEQEEITLQSLLAASESFGKHIDTEVDDTSELRYAKNLIRESLENMTPPAMVGVDLQSIALENFAEQMLNYQEHHAKEEQAMLFEYYKERILEDANARHISENTLQELLGTRITPSITNLISASAIMADNGKGLLRMLGWKDKKDEVSAKNASVKNSGADTETTADAEELEKEDSLRALGEELLEAMTGETEFAAGYESLKSELQKNLEEQQMLWGEFGTKAIDSFSELWRQNWSMSYVRQAEQEGSFYVPMEVGNEMTTIHLTIQKGETKGRVDIGFQTEKFGAVQATLKVSSSQVSMYVEAEGDSIDAVLKRLEQEQGWVRTDAKNMQEENVTEVPAAGVLYQTAKLFITYTKG